MKTNSTIAKLNKKYGNNFLDFANKLKYTTVPRLSSGSLFLDWALGQNEKENTSGWPMGRIIELYGPESAGKSLISLKTIAEAQKKNLSCLYVDCENTYDKDFAEKLGVDNSKLLLSRESHGENIMEMVCKLLEDKAVIVVVFDSIAAIIPQMEVNDPLEQVQMAPVARLMSKALRKLTYLNEEALIILINQLRENPGARYGNPEYTPGGRSLKFYASLRVDVRRGDWIFDAESKKIKVGQIVKFRVVKNKTSPPHREGYFKFLYTGELDKVDELISFGLLHNKIKRAGAYYSFGEHKFLGRDEMEYKLKKDNKLFTEAKERVFG